jgi:hypothetical protein
VVHQPLHQADEPLRAVEHVVAQRRGLLEVQHGARGVQVAQHAPQQARILVQLREANETMYAKQLKGKLLRMRVASHTQMYTPLIMAANEGHQPVHVSALITAGADGLDAALDIATAQGHSAVALALCAGGAVSAKKKAVEKANAEKATAEKATAIDELKQMKMDLDAILTLCSWDSETLCEKYIGFRQEEDELGSFNSRGGVGNYHLRRSDAIALILSHRRDDEAIVFYKKTVFQAKVAAKKMKKAPILILNTLREKRQSRRDKCLCLAETYKIEMISTRKLREGTF